MRANAQTQIIERDLAHLSQRFDRHLEIYAQNGKEFVALKVAVDNLRTVIESKNRDHDIDLVGFKQEFKESVGKIRNLELDVSKLATKVAMYATIGSSIASAGVSILLNFIF